MKLSLDTRDYLQRSHALYVSDSTTTYYFDFATLFKVVDTSKPSAFGEKLKIDYLDLLIRTNKKELLYQLVNEGDGGWTSRC